MSILWGPVTEEAERHFVYLPLARVGECFNCGNRFDEYPVVHWAGSRGHLFLHPGCASEVGKALFIDSRIAMRPGSHLKANYEGWTRVQKEEGGD